MNNDEVEIARRELTELSIKQFGSVSGWYHTAISALNALDLLEHVASVEMPPDHMLPLLELSQSYVQLKVSLEYVAKAKEAIAKARGEA